MSRFLSGLSVTVNDGVTDHACEAIDLSRTGAQLFGTLSLPTLSEVGLTIESSAGDLRLVIRGRLAHVANEEDGIRLGVQFLVLSDEQGKTLEALIARVLECTAPAPIRRLSSDATPAEIVDALQKIPVPHRMLLAGRGQAAERGFLMHDPNPQVLEALTRNPSMNLAEIRALARLTRLLSSTLERISKDERWRNDEELKVIVATHPRAGFPLVEAICKQLSPPALQKVVRESGLNQELKARLMPRRRR